MRPPQVDDNAAVGDLITVNASDVVDAYDIQRDWWHSGADAGDSSSSKKSSSDGFFSLGMILAVVAGVIILICVGVGAFVYNAYENAKNLGETTVRRERPRGAHAHHRRGRARRPSSSCRWPASRRT